MHLQRNRLRWTGHLLRSTDSVLHEVLVFIPTGGVRGRGRHRRRFYDTMKADLQERGVIVNARKQEQFWENVAVLAANRRDWQKIVRGGR